MNSANHNTTNNTTNTYHSAVNHNNVLNNKSEHNLYKNYNNSMSNNITNNNCFKTDTNNLVNPRLPNSDYEKECS